MGRLLFPVLALLALLPTASRGDAVDAAVAALMAKRRFTGLSLAVVGGGRIVRAGGYGVTAGEGSAAVTADTLFQAGSVSKPVAAMGALSLVQAGKLALDADVNLTLRSWRVPENALTKASKVTLREILCHTAGLTVHGFGGYPVGDGLPSLVGVLDGRGNSGEVRVDTIPGTLWRYSGGGYEVMQQMVVDVTGRTFPEFMRAAVLGPLGMRSSSYEQPMAPAMEARAATGHWARGHAVEGRWHVYPEMAAAGLWTTPSDLARFILGAQASYAGAPNPVLSRDMARQMLTVQVQDDGLGLLLAGVGVDRRFWHNGRNAGFDSLLIGYVDGGFGAAIMINQNDDTGALGTVAEAIAQQYAWPAYPAHRPPKPVEDRDPEVTRQVRAIYEGFAAGRLDPALYTPRLAAILQEKMTPEIGPAMRRAGPIKSLALVGREDKDGHTVFKYLLEDENDSFTVTISFDAGGKVSGLFQKPE